MAQDVKWRRRGTHLWLIIDANIPQVDLQIACALHHHAPPHLVLRHLLLEAVLREARVVKVVCDAGAADIVAAVVEVVRHLAVRGHKVEGGAPRGRLGVGGGAVVEQQLGNVLVPVRHGPHERAPVVAVLAVDVGARRDQRLHGALVPEAAGVDERRRAVLVGRVEVHKRPGRAVEDLAHLLHVAVAGRHVEHALQCRPLLVVCQLVARRHRVLVVRDRRPRIRQRRLRRQHLHQTRVAVGHQSLGQVLAVVGVVERQLAEAERLRQHRRRQEL